MFRYSKGRCCGRFVKKNRHYTKIEFNVNVRVDVSTGVESDADKVLRWAARKRQEIVRRGRSLRRQANRCLRRGPCRQRIASRAARIARDIRRILNRLRKSRKSCNGRRGCRRAHRQLAARLQRWSGRISRWAQFATHTSAELVSLAVNGFSQLNTVCKRASCVHGFAVQIRVLVKRLGKERRACRNRRCRRRLNKAIKQVRRPIRKTLVPSLKVAVRACASRKCKRQCKKDIKKLGGLRRQGRRRSGGRRRRPAVIRKLERRANRLIQRQVKRINRVVKRCRRQGASKRQLRKQLRKLHVSAKLRQLFRKAARACRSRKCKQALRRDYESVRSVLKKILPKRVVNLPKRVSRVIRKSTRKSTRKTSRRRKTSRKSRRCAAINKRRASLLKQISACAEDDSRCVRKLFRLVAKLNRKRRGCKSAGARRVKVVDPLSIPNVDWSKEYTCSGLNSAWKKWLSRQRKIRKYFLAHAHACQGSDTTCLRAYLRKLVVIHNRIREQSGHFVHRMAMCDSCQAIKLRFKRWLKRQVRKELVFVFFFFFWKEFDLSKNVGVQAPSYSLATWIVQQH